MCAFMYEHACNVYPPLVKLVKFLATALIKTAFNYPEAMIELVLVWSVFFFPYKVKLG